MIETKYVTVNPAGEWNTAKIISKDGEVEFWLNGYKVVDFEMHNDAWQQMIANSKFKDMPAFGQAKRGHFALQDHGDPVFFKNIKIRNLQEVN
jgi:cytochrome c